jgi:hypothetical protein
MLSELPEIKIDEAVSQDLLTAKQSESVLNNQLSEETTGAEEPGVELHQGILADIERENAKPDADAPLTYAAPNLGNSRIDHEAIYREELQRKREEMFQKLTDQSTAPASHLTNNPKELKVLEYVENFKEQYARLFPNRKELLLMPLNEFGLRVCD